MQGIIIMGILKYHSKYQIPYYDLFRFLEFHFKNKVISSITLYKDYYFTPGSTDTEKIPRSLLNTNKGPRARWCGCRV